MLNNKYSLGVDIGGTFTDVVIYENETGISTSHKELTTPLEPYKGAIAGIRRLCERERIEMRSIGRVVHATTLFTNALIEKKGARTGLITTAGFRDTLEMAREHKYELFDLHIEMARPLVDRRFRKEVDERVLPDGSVERALDVAGLLAATRELVDAGIESIAVVFLHAYANPAHEQQAKAAIDEAFPGLYVSLSSDVSPQIREYERTSTTVANAYVKPLAEGYLERMAAEVRGLGISAPLFMMLSNGGLTHIDEAKRVPIQLLESGPAAGALVGAFFARRSAIEDVLAFDMGGTTAKLAVVEDATPLIAYSFEASREKRFAIGSGIPISISTIELIEIGAGGGSIAHLDPLGLLKVGPESASSMPGPACYGRGGTLPTVTDANLILGYLDPATFAGGTMSIDKAKAEQAFAELSRATGISVPELAWGVYSVVNENMASAARVHVAEKGCNAGDFALLATGGGGPLHGCEVARRLGARTLICPPGAGVASALGLLIAPARIDRSATVAWRLSSVPWDELESAYQALGADACRVIEATLPGKGGSATVTRSADLRFVGQGFEVVTTLPAGPYSKASAEAIRQAFVTEYLKTFSQMPPVSDVEIVNIRVAAVVSAGDDKLALEEGGGAKTGEPSAYREAWSAADKGHVMTPVYQRGDLSPGQRFEGPAIVQEVSTTLVVPARAQVEVDEGGSLIVRLAE